MSDRDREVGYPDIEKVDEDYYGVYIPIPGDVGEDSRGPAHDGGIIDIHLTGDQLIEWSNRLGEMVANMEGDDA